MSYDFHFPLFKKVRYFETPELCSASGPPRGSAACSPALRSCSHSSGISACKAARIRRVTAAGPLRLTPISEPRVGQPSAESAPSPESVELLPYGRPGNTTHTWTHTAQQM